MSKTKDDGGPAFPYSALEPDPETRQLVGSIYADSRGMTLRDYLMAHAPPMPALCINAYVEMLKFNEPEYLEVPWNEGLLNRLALQEARWRVAYADAVLKKRSQ